MSGRSWFVQILALGAAVACGYLLGSRPPRPAERIPLPASPVLRLPPPGPVHRDAGPTIEQVRRLASLVVTKVDVADVSTTEIDGLTGGVRAALVVRGDVVIAVDLAKARFESKDVEKQSAVLVLPPPAMSHPRLDHGKTRLFELSRQGLWAVVPGEGGQAAAVNHAYRHAQATVAAAGSDAKLVERARDDAEQTLSSFFQALGWEVTVCWDDRP